MTIEEFIQARLDEDEQIARSAIDPERPGAHWRWETVTGDEPLQPGVEVETVQQQAISLRTVEEYPTRYVGPLPAFIISRVEARLPGGLCHIARHDPARVLRQCAMMRDLFERARPETECRGHPGPWMSHDDYGPGFCGNPDIADSLRVIAAIWSGHPDYDPSWAVDGGGSNP